MKVLVLTSRYTATRDIIGEDFGRQTRLFSALSKRGHDIHFFCADYRMKERKNVVLHGIKVMIRPFGVVQCASFLNDLSSTIKKGAYDVLIATSDPLWGVIGYQMTRKTSTKFVYDLHDNYETYAMYSLPFFGLFEKHALKKARLVTTVSHALKEYISPYRKENVVVIQNGVDMAIFKPMPKKKCRQELNLSTDAKIIIYAGSIQRMQGVDILVEAFEELRKKEKNVQLVIAGRFFRREAKHIDLDQEGIHYLGGDLTQHQVAMLINAADVAVVPNRENAFTLHCFPYKVAEYMACNTPIAATRVGDVTRMLEKFPQSLCDPDDNEGLKKTILIQMKKDKVKYRKVVAQNTWDAIAKQFDLALRKI